MIDTKDTYEKVKNDNYQYIYVENNNLYEQIKGDDRVILKLPKVIEHSRTVNYPVMISELGGLENKNIIASDFSLNVVNSYAVALLHSLGVSRVTLSYELTKVQIERMVKAYHERYNSLPNLEIIAYSKVEAMITKFNINKYYNTNNQLFLVDKFANKYLIEERNGFTYIIDYKDHWLKDYQDYYNIGVSSIRFEFKNTDYKKIL